MPKTKEIQIRRKSAETQNELQSLSSVYQTYSSSGVELAAQVAGDGSEVPRLHAWSLLLEYDGPFHMRMVQYPNCRLDSVDIDLWTSNRYHALSEPHPQPQGRTRLPFPQELPPWAVLRNTPTKQRDITPWLSRLPCGISASEAKARGLPQFLTTSHRGLTSQMTLPALLLV